MKLATLTITVHDDRTTVRTLGGLRAVPALVLDAAIGALQHERSNVHKCPAQRARDRDAIHEDAASRLSPKGGSLGRSEAEASPE